MAAGVIIPDGYDGAVRAGHAVTLRYLARPDQSSQQLGETVRGAVARQAALLGAGKTAVAQHAVASFRRQAWPGPPGSLPRSLQCQ